MAGGGRESKIEEEPELGTSTELKGIVEDKTEGLVKTQGGEAGFMEDTSNDKRGARNSHSMG